jgi:hypothetical protein
MSERSRYPDDSTGRTLALMAEEGFHMDRPIEIDFQVAVPTESAAWQVAELARTRGYRTDVYDSPKCSLPWTCECTVVMVPTYEAVVAAEKEVDEIGRRCGGFADGFGSFGDIRNH